MHTKHIFGPSISGGYEWEVAPGRSDSASDGSADRIPISDCNTTCSRLSGKTTPCFKERYYLCETELITRGRPR